MVDEYRKSFSTQFSEVSVSSRNDQHEDQHVRKATLADFREIYELSTCIYKEHDWLAANFTRILQKENNHIFVAVIGEKIAGCVLCCVVDSDSTLVMWGMRIHPQFRRRNISHELREAVFAFVKENYPSVCYERLTTITENSHVERLRVKLGFKKILDLKAFSVVISNDIRKLLDKVLQASIPNTISLIRFRKDDALNFITGIQKHHKNHIPTRTVIMEYVSYELTQSNANVFLEENDLFLVDKDITRLTTSERLRNAIPGLKPCAVASLSHGRVVQRVKHSHWETTLYTNDSASFREHLLLQMKEALQATKEKFVFTCFHSEYNSILVWEVLIQELCLRQVMDKHVVPKLIVYERPIIDSAEHDTPSTSL